MSPLMRALSMAALVAGLPSLTQPAAAQPARRAETKTKKPPAQERTQEQAASKPKPLDGGSVTWGLGEEAADARLAQRIRKALQDDARLSVAAKTVTLRVGNGLVRLQGLVETEAERTLVRQHATDAAGLDNVVDELEVRGTGAPPTM